MRLSSTRVALQRVRLPQSQRSELSKSVPIMKSNRSTGPGFLSFSAYKDLDVYIHGTEDIPWIQGDEDMHFEVMDNAEFLFEMIEIANDPMVKEVDLETRKCRFTDETLPSRFDKSFRIYGYTTCMVICETELMYQKCECVSHLRDSIYRELACNYSGLGCLAIYDEEKKKISEEIKNRCSHCLPSCEEVELKRIFLFEEDKEEDEDIRVTVRMSNLPNIKYVRNVVRTKLDFVVSIGGLAGLFFGASLLSLVEAVYIIFFRSNRNTIDRK